MKLPKLKNLKKHLKPMLSAIKKIGAYTRTNLLGLINLSLLLHIAMELKSVQDRLDAVQGALGKIYIDVLQAIGFDAMLLMGLIQKLFGGEEA